MIKSNMRILLRYSFFIYIFLDYIALRLQFVGHVDVLCYCGFPGDLNTSECTFLNIKCLLIFTDDEMSDVIPANGVYSFYADLGP